MRRWTSRITWAVAKPWCTVVALFGAGMLPCPDCGAPMAIHFWPAAIFLALRTYVRQRRVEAEPAPEPVTDPAEKGRSSVDLA
jgi:hypothetical protein